MKEKIDLKIMQLKAELRSVHLGPRQKKVLEMVVQRLEKQRADV